MLLSPASVARYVFKSFWKRVRLLLANGVAVAKVDRAKSREFDLESAKLMEEKLMPPEDTSGTDPMVVTAVLQVMLFSMAVTDVCTSAGSATSPTTKHGLARAVRGAESHQTLLM